MSLKEYKKKRDFTLTPEPSGKSGKLVRKTDKRKIPEKKLLFVVQKHAASHLHYDFRLEHDGVLLSWAVPKGPSMNPTDKRLAMHVEDHPIDYADFEGIIPKGQYGGGTVIVWDTGYWMPLSDVNLRSKKLLFVLAGKKLKGTFALIRMDDKSWLLIKEKDEFASKKDIIKTMPESVKSGKTLEEVTKQFEAGKKTAVWESSKAIIKSIKKRVSRKPSAKPKKEK